MRAYNSDDDATWYLTISEYFRFYDENKEKIYIPAELRGIHPVNEDAVQRWKHRIVELSNEAERNFYLFFAEGFSQILKRAYVDFNLFLSRIEQTAAELIELFIANEYDSIFFVLTGEMDKSNVWISLLVFDHLVKDVRFVKYVDKIRAISISRDTVTSRFLPINKIAENIGTKKNMFLHFDDMSYSGGQVAQDIKLFLNTAKIKLGSMPYIDYYLAIPYLTTVAKEYILSNNEGVKVLSSSVIVPSFEQQFQEYYLALSAEEQAHHKDHMDLLHDMCHPYWMIYSGSDRYTLQMKSFTEIKAKNIPKGKRPGDFRGMTRYSPENSIQKGIMALRCASFKTLIYFDHKLADDASTFQKVLYFGSYPINSTNSNGKKKPCIQESLITNCSINPEVLSQMEQSSQNSCRNYIQSGSKMWNIDQKYVCPPTFYKNIEYTFCKVPTRSGLLPYVLKLNRTLYDNINEFYFQLRNGQGGSMSNSITKEQHTQYRSECFNALSAYKRRILGGLGVNGDAQMKGFLSKWLGFAGGRKRATKRVQKKRRVTRKNYLGSRK